MRPSDVGGKQGEQLSLGDALAYRMWKVLIVAHATYVKRYSPGEKSGPRGKSENFEEAMANGGDSWRYKSIQFKKRDGVAYWLSKAGDWIPVDAQPSEDCRRCTAARKLENMRHWCFRCQLWSRRENPWRYRDAVAGNEPPGEERPTYFDSECLFFFAFVTAASVLCFACH